MKNFFRIFGLILAVILFCAGLVYLMCRDSRNRAIESGRMYRENGWSIQANPYGDQTHRDYWRQGWREAKEIKE
jgi:ribosome modulation factor